jgi:1-deoxyxylulose-5-phosphate synthase
LIYGEIAGVGRPLSRVVLGAGSLDDPRYDDAAALFDAYVAAGGTAIDTAAVYGDGASERVVGQWLRRSGCRDEVVIVTKGGHPDLSDWQPRLTPEDVEQDLNESLDRLGVDCVDLYLLHRDNEEIQVDELVDMLASHAGAGQVKAVGVSNWTWSRVEEANEYAAESGAPRMAANSVHYSLATPKGVIAPGAVSLCDDPTALAWYAKSGLPVLAWSSQAKGFFSGRFAPTVHDSPHVEQTYYHKGNWQRLERVNQLARDRGWLPSQVALAWLFNQPLDIFAVVGPTRLPHLNECMGAVDLHLTPSEVAWLNLGQGGADE